ncbi:MAG: hypothetical protein ACLRPV_05865 [Lacrimispora saccharolytica]
MKKGLEQAILKQAGLK